MAAELRIYDEIVSPAERKMWGLGVDAELFAEQLRETDGDLTVRINSPGGDVDNGLAIYNLLLGARREGRRVTCLVDGAAHSAASIICMAGDEVRMAESSSMLVHHPWCLAMGNADELRQVAQRLDTATDKLVPAYREKTGLSDETVRALMTAETELLPAKAVELKFADKVEAAPERAAKMWAADGVRHPLARAALETIQARAQRERPRAQGAKMETNPEPAAVQPPPPPLPAAQDPQAEAHAARRAAALGRLKAKRLPQQILAAVEPLELEALERYEANVGAFPLPEPAAATGMPAAPPPLPGMGKPKLSKAHSAVARQMGLDPDKVAAHSAKPWHGGAVAKDDEISLEELLDEEETELAAQPMTPAASTAAAALGVPSDKLEQHRKAPWHRRA